MQYLYRKRQAYFGYIASDVSEHQFVVLACIGHVSSAVAKQTMSIAVSIRYTREEA